MPGATSSTVRARRQPADPARPQRLPRARAGERHRLRRRLRSQPGPCRADRSAGDPEDRDLPRALPRCASARRRSAASSRRSTTAFRPSAPFGGVAAELKAAGTTVDNGWESALLLDAGSRNAAIHADVFGRRVGNYRIPSYPYLFPPDPPPVVDGTAAELVGPRRGRQRWAARGCSTAAMPASRSPASPAIITSRASRPRSDRSPSPAGADQDHQQGRVPPGTPRDRRRPLLGRLHRLQARRARV